MARDCELPDTCRRCGSEDHKVAECTEEEKTRTIVGEVISTDYHSCIKDI